MTPPAVCRRLVRPALLCWCRARGDDGSEVILRKATGPQYVVADWPAEHACAAAAALAAALAEAGAAPLEGCVEDVQGMPSGDEYYVASRRVHASPESFTHPSGSAAASLQELLTDDGGTVGPAAVLLTHVFALPGDAPQRLRLATLVVVHARPLPPRLLAWVFGADAHVALSSPKDFVFTDVALGDAASLSAEALAALPAATRDALRAALRTQRLAATAACIEARWPAGFCALHSGAAALKSALGPALAALATGLVPPQSGGGPTRASLHALIDEAETLEAAGRFLDAAVLYKQALDADVRNPGARLLPTPPQTWAFYGLALKRAECFRDARAAYDAGLHVLQTGPVDPETPEWRETQRIELHGLIMALAHTLGDKAMQSRAYQQLFASRYALCQATVGEDVMLCLDHHDAPSITGTISGRSFGVVHYRETSGPNSGLKLSRVEELPIADPASLPSLAHAWGHQTAQQAAALARTSAREVLVAREAAALPKLPQARCARCGEAASKRCAACGGPAYCGAACQKLDWKRHKPECKAACAASAAEKQSAA